MGENSRIAKNTIMLYIRMLAVMAVSLYTSRIILQNLGVSDFGLYSVVGGVATMFIFLNGAMSSVTQRYLSIEIGKNDDDQLKKTFNVSFIIHVLIGIGVVILCEAVGLWFIHYKMQIPEGRETAVFWTFQISMVMTFLSMITVPFNALLISRERMGVFAYISIFDVLFKLLVAYLIASAPFDKLIYYALLMAFSQLIVLAIYVVYCKVKFVESRFCFCKFDTLYKEMVAFASWGLLGHFSSIVTTSIQDMMLNAFFSPIVNAARGVAIRVSTAVQGFSKNFQLAVEPQITISFAQGRIDRTFSLIDNSSRFSLYLLYFLSLPIVLCVDEILRVWLVEVPEYTAPFIILVMLNNIIVSTANALNMAIRANGKIKYPEVVGGIVLILNLPLSLLFLKLGYSPLSVFIVTIFCTILAQCVRIYYAHKYIHLPVRNYITNVFVKPFLIMLVSAVIPSLISYKVSFGNDLMKILVITICSSVSILLFVYTLGMTHDERQLVASFIKNKLNNRHHKISK